MDDPLDRAYLSWLGDQVGPGHTNPRVTYWDLLRQMYTKRFEWYIHNDDNRAEDGLEVRREFLHVSGIIPDQRWVEDDCSFLEMLIGLSGRLAFEAEGEPSEWFWHLIQNLGLNKQSDNHYKKTPRLCEHRVDEAMERVIWRNYLPNGRGGLFPLDHSRVDQRDVEIWYQMSVYILERD